MFVNYSWMRERRIYVFEVFVGNVVNRDGKGLEYGFWKFEMGLFF